MAETIVASSGISTVLNTMYTRSHRKFPGPHLTPSKKPSLPRTVPVVLVRASAQVAVLSGYIPDQDEGVNSEDSIAAVVVELEEVELEVDEEVEVEVEVEVDVDVEEVVVVVGGASSP